MINLKNIIKLAFLLCIVLAISKKSVVIAVCAVVIAFIGIGYSTIEARQAKRRAAASRRNNVNVKRANFSKTNKGNSNKKKKNKKRK